MNICFVLQNSYCSGGNSMPLGLFYVADALRRAGNKITFLEFIEGIPSINEIKAAIKQQISKNNIEAVMCGALVVGWKEVRDIFKAVKQLDENILTVGGGGFFTHSPIEAMKLCPDVDVGIIGEGEIISCKLVESVVLNEPMNNVKGIIYRNDCGELIQTEKGEIVEDLDSLPFPQLSPEYEMIVQESKTICVTFSRSCPFECTFCSLSTYKKYRKRSVQSITLEIKNLKIKYDVRNLVFLDELFSSDTDRICKICDELKKLDIRFWAQLRPNNNLTFEAIRAIKDAGVYSLGMGVENFNDEILTSMEKKTTVAMLKRCFDLIEQADCNRILNFNLLFGDTEETFETAVNSLKFYKSNIKKYANIPCFIISLYPGSKIYANAVASGKIVDSCEYIRMGLPVLNISKLSDGLWNALVAKISILPKAYFKKPPDIRFYQAKDSYFVEYKCSCSENNEYVSFAVHKDFQYSSPNICEKCYKLMDSAVQQIGHDYIGQKIAKLLEEKRCAFWGVRMGLSFISKWILDGDYDLIDKGANYTANDFLEWENALGEQPVMSRILSEHNLYNRFPENRTIDTVIVTAHRYFKEIKQEIIKVNPLVHVIDMYDFIQWDIKN